MEMLVVVGFNNRLSNSSAIKERILQHLLTHPDGRLGAAGAIGLYLGLTGRRLSAPEDLLYSRLGTHQARAEQLPSLRDALVHAPLSRHADKRKTLYQLEVVLQKFQASCQLLTPIVLLYTWLHT
jgi:hypothetical protein